ncbi:hypothetical protein C8Q75DRAFT_733319 [Abortiporus biennis]|nr:hypothetical protein C8Q75DRAFT_733319 [Abortiporus biennis]
MSFLSSLRTVFHKLAGLICLTNSAIEPALASPISAHHSSATLSLVADTHLGDVTNSSLRQEVVDSPTGEYEKVDKITVEEEHREDAVAMNRIVGTWGRSEKEKDGRASPNLLNQGGHEFGEYAKAQRENQLRSSKPAGPSTSSLVGLQGATRSTQRGAAIHTTHKIHPFTAANANQGNAHRRGESSSGVQLGMILCPHPRLPSSTGGSSVRR